MSKSDIDTSNFSFMHVQNYNNDFTEIENESTPKNSLPQKTLPWDAFKQFPVKKESASMQSKECLHVSIQVIKVFIYGFLFCLVLCAGLMTKFVVFLAIAQLQDEKSIEFCDYYNEYNPKPKARISKKGKVVWTWYIIFMFLIPECLTIFRAMWYFIFKKKKEFPKKQSIAILFILETLHPIGVALLIFYSLPKLNSVDAAAISSCVCFIPALLNLITQHKKLTNTTSKFILILAGNSLALVVQSCGVSLQTFFNLDEDPLIYVLIIALVLSSSRWWCNYVTHSNCCGFLNFLARTKMDLMNKCHILQAYIAFWRCLVFVSSAIMISILKEIQIQELFDFTWQEKYDVELIKMSNHSFRNDTELSTPYLINDTSNTIIDTSTPFYCFVVQIFCAFITYKAAKFAYQTQMHKPGFALPISLVTPGTIMAIAIFCFTRKGDPCTFHDLMPNYLFLSLPKYNNITEFISTWRIWCWIILWLSQIWITMQLWLDENERVAPVEKIFYQSSYDSFLIDQFLGLNKRRYENSYVIDKKDEEEEEEIELSDDATKFETIDSLKIQDLNGCCSTRPQSTINNKRNTCVPQIYACATMWHEGKEEMSELIKSILRLDKDQCAMKVTQKYYDISIEDYYELETHVTFDDAFHCMHRCIGPCNHNKNETEINEYVATFVEMMQENIKNLGMLDLPPTKYPTPYGGQLIWTLPGKTRLTVHLKDKNKIRHRKRWSQVMYMYYLLGYRLMGSSLDVDTKELMAENTYILTLDGDVDFHPNAVKTLIDLMKKDKNLGAACGRVHPIGRGPIIWFQKFEYAIGHWLQKTTEHTIGSVLCSPGCFSLFRAKALMQHNVIATYATKSTEPKHYIQYDQGEDRWLCTLILQVGGRVEYCAASDAYTHAPESFKELYNQRRRWIPSTMANIFDLLRSSREIRKINNNISWLYIAYQYILTGSTIIGPSFIYLMMVGAFVTSFQIDNWLSFWYNSIPITIFILICFFCNERIQLITAEVITVLYGIVMMVVLVGIILQIAADGSFAPNTLLFFIVIGQFIATGFMHPQEVSCLPNAMLYYITVPSMYMLLMIFSIFNLHNVTWGTRESQLQRQLSEKQNTQIGESESEEQGKTITNKWKNVSLSTLFKCSFCTYENPEKEENYLGSIYDSINEINLRLKQIESNFEMNKIPEEDIENKSNCQCQTYSEELKIQVSEHLDTSTDSEDEISEESSVSECQKNINYLINPHWFKDERLQNAKVDFLPFVEEEFWKQLINKYLFPIENDVKKQQTILKGLINIRNQCLLKFFMINILFIVAIFLLQINKDILYIQWPFAIQYIITYNDEYEVLVFKKHMHLEPIGCLFIIAFVSILVIQFIAMLNHRFNTFVHILANVKLNFLCFNKEQYSTNDLITSKHAKKIAKGLQNTTEYRTIFDEQDNATYLSRRRKTVRELIEDTQNPSKIHSNFEVLFLKRLREPNTSGLTKTISSSTPKGTIEAFEEHRSNILARHSKLHSQNDKHNGTRNNELPKHHTYDNPSFLDDNNK